MSRQFKIRTDGDSQIGLGHIIRCISLAHMIDDEFAISFYSKRMPESLKKQIEEEGWGVTLINQDSEFLSSLKANEIAVLDGYQFDSSYQLQIKKTGAKLVCIDDYHEQYFHADLVINHAPGVSEEDYKGVAYTKYLLGPDYALLRPEFLNPSNSNKRNFKNEINNIFICFGGSDPKNMTCKILEWLPKYECNVTVIMGNMYQHHVELKNAIRRRKDLTVSVKSSLSAKQMRTEMINADLGIVPASGILFEALSTELPVISGYYTENQKSLFKGFLDLKCITGIGSFRKKDFIDGLENLQTKDLETYSIQSKEVIDRSSNIRIKEEILQL